VTVTILPTQQTINRAEANVMHQSLTIHALRPSFAMTGSAFAMIVTASPSKKVATGAAESSVSLGKTSTNRPRSGACCDQAGCLFCREWEKDGLVCRPSRRAHLFAKNREFAMDKVQEDSGDQRNRHGFSRRLPAGPENENFSNSTTLGPLTPEQRKAILPSEVPIEEARALDAPFFNVRGQLRSMGAEGVSDAHSPESTHVPSRPIQSQGFREQK
jgi:hypothetical protein